jgi:hypothetical protein
MGESEEELERRDDEDRETHQEAILDGATVGAWLDHEPVNGEDRPPEGDLPDNPPAPTVSLFARIMRALRGS